MNNDQRIDGAHGAGVSVLERPGGFAQDQRFSAAGEPTPKWPIYDSAEWDTNEWRDARDAE